MAPFGFVMNGVDDDVIVDNQGDVWSKADPYDEYGTSGGGWTLWSNY
jgi:hypothetical protein